MKHIRRFVMGLAVAIAYMFVNAAAAFSQQYPSKPIRIITAEPGGATDFAARVIAQKLTAILGQPAIVENRGGAAGAIAAPIVAKAMPDGYTLLFHTDSLWLSPFLRDVPYDPIADFAPVTLAAISPNVLVVHPSVPARSVKELIALARARPGELNFATGATASSTHLAAELFKKMAGLQMARVPYRGAGPGLVALAGGHVHLMFPSANSGMPYVKSGKLRGLGVASAQSSRLVPDLPTIASAGLPGFETASTNAMFAPARTPASIVNVLNAGIVKILNDVDVRDKLASAGLESAGGTPEQLTAKLKSEMNKWGKLIKEAGIRTD